MSRRIRNTALTSEFANAACSHIYALDTCLDATFLSTLRCLLGERINKDNATLHLRYAADLDVANDYYTVNVVAYDAVYPDTLRGFMRLSNLETYFRTHKTQVKIFRGNTDRSRGDVVIVFENTEKRDMSLSDWHLIQAAIPRYFPELFENSPLSELEMALLKSLQDDDMGEYMSVLDKLVGLTDFRETYVKSALGGFEHQFKNKMMDKLRHEVASEQDYYENLIGRAREHANKIRTLKLQLAGLMALGDEEENSQPTLVDYFLCNKNLTINSGGGTSDWIGFTALGHVDIYNEDAAERYIANRNSFLYPEGILTANAEKLYRSIFLDYKYKLRIGASFDISFENWCTTSFKYRNNAYYPNPHINNHGCIGEYGQRVVECMNEHDYIGVVQQLEASTRSLNFTDSAVMSRFAKEFFSTTIKCLEDAETGELLSPTEAMAKYEGSDD